MDPTVEPIVFPKDASIVAVGLSLTGNQLIEVLAAKLLRNGCDMPVNTKPIIING
jgi:hypothetical protein